MPGIICHGMVFVKLWKERRDIRQFLLAYQTINQDDYCHDNN